MLSAIAKIMEVRPQIIIRGANAFAKLIVGQCMHQARIDEFCSRYAEHSRTAICDANRG
jgi:hypothetical protein